ncbi:MAG TPA: anhydro-N-acetylmuramic acid kinase [Terriglobales bacterium]|nr:anhydro-N-acetylmuramic acid kinase [Terriglobales bacterium]
MGVQRTGKTGDHKTTGPGMIVAGVMSGTSADGINVALVRVNSSPSRAGTPVLHFLAHAEYPYPKQVRRAVLAAMNSTRARVADLARLNFLLAELYADAVLATERRFHLKAALVGCHGQTLYHQGEAATFLGRKLAVTWQTGEGAVLAARLGVPVVSDFRPADMAVGGKGAPLVPFLDFLLYRDPRVGRVVQNIGGIANFTAIPAGASVDRVLAFDTGPGNMVIDAVMQRLFGKSYDRDGRIAGSGNVLDGVINDILRTPFFRRKPPKTAGREEFGREFTHEFIRRCGRVDKRDIVATATALTARSIADALRRFVIRRTGTYRDFIVSGGGSNNPTLVAMLANELRPLGLQIRSSDEFGLPSEAKEAAAFALLAFQTWNRRPSNLPSATGAKRPATLGKISYA